MRPNNYVIFCNITNWSSKNTLSLSGAQKRNKVVNVPPMSIGVNDFVNKKRGETIIGDVGVNKAID